MKPKLGYWLAVTVALAAVALAQPKFRMPNYNAATEAKISGTIEDVQQMPHGRMTGIHIIVKTGSETADAHLGPSDFIAGKGFTFAKGDSVEIVGSKVKMNGADALIAREITKGGNTLTLRDQSGRPLWAGRRGKAN